MCTGNEDDNKTLSNTVVNNKIANEKESDIIDGEKFEKGTELSEQKKTEGDNAEEDNVKKAVVSQVKKN